MAGSNPKFEDKGFLGPNQYAKSDSHPTHKGKVTLSPKTLKELNRRYQDGEPVDLEISGWRKSDDPKSFKLSIQPAYQKEAVQSSERSRGSFRRDDEENDRPRARRREDDGDEAPRRVASRSRDRDREEDDFPGDRPRRASDSRRDYGDDGDL